MTATTNALRERAAWHRAQAQDFLNNSVASMRQHEAEAEQLEGTAAFLDAQERAKQDMEAGHITAYATGHSYSRGRYIEVCSDQGWDPEPYWRELPPEELA